MTAVAELEQLLKTGMTAYQQGAYEQATASLSQLSRTTNQAYRMKAKMGLVRTYMAQKDWQRARSLCQEISQSPKLAAQQWAAAILTKIERQITQPIQNLSGFQPIAPDEAIAPPSQARQPELDLAKPLPVGQSDSQADQADERSDAQVSMFHYAYLNGEIAAAPTDEDRAVTALQDESKPSQAADSEAGYQRVYAGRLAQGRSLGKLKRGQLRTAQIGGAIAFYFFLRSLIYGAIALTNGYLNFLDSILPFGVSQIPATFLNSAWVLLGSLVGIAIASPWLWDIWLQATADRQPLSSQQLRTYSAEAVTLLSRQCQQRRWQLPTLWQLPTEVPLIFSYGWHPRQARLVVSQGLLSQLAADEIAALVAYEISHWKVWYWPLLSAQSLILQLFHQAYWQLALWGAGKPKPIKIAAGTLANLSYSIFWLMRLPGLWPSRVRTYYGDRDAAEITGNPNGLARALAKLSFALAASVEQQGYTLPLIESLALLLPVSADLSRQQLYGSLPLGQLYAWDSLNPLRDWMSVRAAQPPLGDRLRLVMAYAKHWQLDLEMQIEVPPRRKGLSASDWSQLISQGTPFFGLAIGVATGLGLWLVGALAQLLDWQVLAWMNQDIGLFQCCLLLGLGVGTALRINRFFPDLSYAMPPTQALPDWVNDPDLLPSNSLPARLSGTVTGRPELANWLGQDLLLKTSSGLLKLHFFTALGPLGNVIGLGRKPAAWFGQSVQVLGWFRRGNQPWLDIDKIRLDNNSSNGSLIQAAHPIHSLLLAIAACGLGLCLLIQSSS
ncbi:M48 family metalloprotease [Leptolyngbya sp. BC1307]|uniref:M48 family metallopeptidase n=1 Tax=Leptolyngbya sp. BC1307 TaxID=2029589 RepID=UPI000EFB377B|nr:M48 family metalloprotease [Leptolyngbya sp. BC1307]